MGLGTYKIPEEIRDEDKYLSMTKQDIFILAIAAIIGLGMVAFFSKIHLVIVGLVLGIFLFISVAASVLIKIPEDRYLLGTGNALRIIVYRVVRKRIGKKKCIYIRNGDR